MNVIVTLDENNGMAFNGRSQSRDQAVLARALQMAAGHKLWMAPESAPLFPGAPVHAAVDFLDKAGPGDFCWVENRPLSPFAGKIEKLVCFRWNRRYPGDVFLDLPLERWRLAERMEFPGTSHEKITMEVYVP